MHFTIYRKKSKFLIRIQKISRRMTTKTTTRISLIQFDKKKSELNWNKIVFSNILMICKGENFQRACVHVRVTIKVKNKKAYVLFIIYIKSGGLLETDFQHLKWTESFCCYWWFFVVVVVVEISHIYFKRLDSQFLFFSLLSHTQSFSHKTKKTKTQKLNGSTRINVCNSDFVCVFCVCVCLSYF